MLIGIVAQEHKKIILPPAGYTPKAVRFDNTVAPDSGLTIASVAEGSVSSLTLSIWVRHGAKTSHTPSIFSTSVVFPQLAISTSKFTTNDVVVQFSFTATPTSFQFVTTQLLLTPAVWHHFFFSYNLTTQAANLLIDGTATTNSTGTQQSPPSSVNFNGVAAGWPTNSSSIHLENTTIDYCDLWMALGQYVTAANITQFRTTAGRPVDLGSNGATPTGTSPTFFFSGDATTFGTNKGTGDAVTVTGTIHTTDAP